MPDMERLQSELEVFELMVSGFVGSILRAARQIPDDRWNWSFSERTPTPREICEHAFVWLWCDRQQMTVEDRALHCPTPDLPPEREEMIRLLEEEGEEWRRLVRSLQTDRLGDERESWDGETRNLRSFLFHIGQHLIYKAGQIYVLHYELGLDGPDPYDAPHPNRIYAFADVPPWPSPRAVS
jgi:uncharacterized damage-inducible protein DinB